MLGCIYRPSPVGTFGFVYLAGDQQMLRDGPALGRALKLPQPAFRILLGGRVVAVQGRHRLHDLRAQVKAHAARG